MIDDDFGGGGIIVIEEAARLRAVGGEGGKRGQVVNE